MRQYSSKFTHLHSNSVKDIQRTEVAKKSFLTFFSVFSGEQKTKGTNVL